MSRFRLSYIVKVLLDFRLLFRGLAPPDCLYKRRPCSPKVGSEEREGATQLSRTPSKASARDSEQPHTPSGSSLVTLAKLELPQYSTPSTSG
jgi:hypothetical protein